MYSGIVIILLAVPLVDETPVTSTSGVHQETSREQRKLIMLMGKKVYVKVLNIDVGIAVPHLLQNVNCFTNSLNILAADNPTSIVLLY